MMRLLLIFLLALSTNTFAFARGGVGTSTELVILHHEDTRNWDRAMNALLHSNTVAVRQRAILAAGRIEDPSTTPELARILSHDPNAEVRARAAFALGQIQSPSSIDALVASATDRSEDAIVRARSIEALGRIDQALSKKDPRREVLSETILKCIETEIRKPSPNYDLKLLGITAIMRSKPTDATSALDAMLDDKSWRIRADAAEALGRVGAGKSLPKLRELLTNDPDAVVRANAAFALGKAKDSVALAQLEDRAQNDSDLRVRVSAVRALGQIADKRAAPVLESRLQMFLQKTSQSPTSNDRDATFGEMLEVATALGQVEANSKDDIAYQILARARSMFPYEAEIAIAAISVDPERYLRPNTEGNVLPKINPVEPTSPSQQESAEAQACQTLATYKGADSAEVKTLALGQLRSMLKASAHQPKAASDILSAYAAYDPKDLDTILTPYFHDPDVYVRATAVGLVGNEPETPARTEILSAALKQELDGNPNDVAISALDSLAQQHTKQADDEMVVGFKSKEYLVRREAALDLKTNGVGDFDAKIGHAETRNTTADYLRAIYREGKSFQADVATDRGSFTIALLTDNAPLTVDNFIQLVKHGFYNGLTFHRVVPNFVVQGGDSHGDGAGGPGYQIRDEINMSPYDTGAVGMALSGRDTGGSQFFVTHSPEPHLDGGYTVFGNVVKGMDVVNRIQRGDRIRRVTINEVGR